MTARQDGELTLAVSAGVLPGVFQFVSRQRHGRYICQAVRSVSSGFFFFFHGTVYATWSARMLYPRSISRSCRMRAAVIASRSLSRSSPVHPSASRSAGR